MAYVVATQPTSLNSADIIAACRAQLPPAKVPALVDFVTTLPRTIDGKVRHFILRREAAARITDLGG